MKIIEYLFFKYYYFQIKVGNEDIAPLSTILFISMIIEIIYADFICFCFFYLPCFINLQFPSIYSFILIYIVCFLVLYFLVIYKKKYKGILINHKEEWKGKKQLGAILFVIIPYVIFFIELFLKIQLNRLSK